MQQSSLEMGMSRAAKSRSEECRAEAESEVSVGRAAVDQGFTTFTLLVTATFYKPQCIA